MFTKKETEILLGIAYNPNMTIWRYAKDTNSTYSYAHQVITKFEKQNILKITKIKSKKHVDYTEIGKVIIKPVKEYVRELKKHELQNNILRKETKE